MQDSQNSSPVWHGTTILTVRKGGKVVVGGDGQVSIGQTVIKSNAKKVRKLGKGDVIGGFAGATADAFTLFERLESKLEQYPGLFDRDAMLACRTMYEFDNIVTAPLHGFADADDYWTKATTRPLLPAIDVPTLILNARNDPFLPESALPGPADVSPAVELDQPADGGHAGFMTGPFPGRLDWLSARVFGYCSKFVDHG